MTARGRRTRLISSCALAALIAMAAKRTPPAQAAPLQEVACLATITGTNIERNITNCGGTTATNYAYFEVKVDFTCGPGDGSGLTECGTWGNWSYATATNSAGPWTPRPMNPPPKPALSRTYSCGVSGWNGFNLSFPNMIWGAFYQVTMTFGPQNAQGQGGGNGGHNIVEVVGCPGD